MTRINTIDVADLTDQHLMAEYRELPMVNASLARSLKSKKGLDLSRIPPKYTLNTGHVMQFYNKGKWLHDRYKSLIEELNKRGYNINPDDRKVDWNVFTDNGLYEDWTPDEGSYVVNADRIIERVHQRPDWYTMNKNKVPADVYERYIKTKYYEEHA